MSDNNVWVYFVPEDRCVIKKSMVRYDFRYKLRISEPQKIITVDINCQPIRQTKSIHYRRSQYTKACHLAIQALKQTHGQDINIIPVNTSKVKH